MTNDNKGAGENPTPDPPESDQPPADDAVNIVKFTPDLTEIPAQTIGHCGFVTIAGRPNVGKSSLLNKYVGCKISITSRRPQTTRNRLLGVVTRDMDQVVFVDTPGIHSQQKKELNRIINRTAQNSLEGVDVIVMMISATGWKPDDDLVYRKATETGVPIVLVINKCDLLEQRDALLPFIEEIAKTHIFSEIVPISVKKSYNLEHLLDILIGKLPIGPHGFPQQQMTDRSQRFLASELIREKMFRYLGQELPYSSAVEITSFSEQDDGLLKIEATIWVEKQGQKAIVIGRGGVALKNIGQRAREDMERLFQSKVYLGLWVKVRTGWTENAQVLKSLGYDEW
ncbi:MAG: GTPase Era [marine bacterium B5-7]|nr:MAG: GTPase Era [marine bacterium B5-7]